MTRHRHLILAQANVYMGKIAGIKGYKTTVLLVLVKCSNSSVCATMLLTICSSFFHISAFL